MEGSCRPRCSTLNPPSSVLSPPIQRLLAMIRQPRLLRLVDRDHHAPHQCRAGQHVGLHVLVDGLGIEPTCLGHEVGEDGERVVADGDDGKDEQSCVPPREHEGGVAREDARKGGGTRRGEREKGEATVRSRPVLGVGSSAPCRSPQSGRQAPQWPRRVAANQPPRR